MDSLKVTDAASEAVAVAPRVKLSDIESAIMVKYFLTGSDAARVSEWPEEDQLWQGGRNLPASLNSLTICLLVMKNGFTVIGKSAPASHENFNADLGKQYAYEDAVRQLWPLMGFALRDKLSHG